MKSVGILQRRVQNPLTHLRWSFGFQPLTLHQKHHLGCLTRLCSPGQHSLKIKQFVEFTVFRAPSYSHVYWISLKTKKSWPRMCWINKNRIFSRTFSFQWPKVINFTLRNRRKSCNNIFVNIHPEIYKSTINENQ